MLFTSQQNAQRVEGHPFRKRILMLGKGTPYGIRADGPPGTTKMPQRRLTTGRNDGPLNAPPFVAATPTRTFDRDALLKL